MDNLASSFIAHGPTQILAVALFVLVLVLVYGAASRLILSPVAHFPGPMLAGLTFWYEFYYDVVLRGKYTWKIKELHKKYGEFSRSWPI